jgi:phosphoglycerate dehydrogenase-like enzyme
MARAAIVDYDALAATLRAGRLSGAILDVFDPEPLPSDSELWDCPRLVVTPHISSDPLDYTERWLEIFASNLTRFASEEPLSNQVRLDAGY